MNKFQSAAALVFYLIQFKDSTHCKFFQNIIFKILRIMLQELPHRHSSCLSPVMEAEEQSRKQQQQQTVSPVTITSTTTATKSKIPVPVKSPRASFIDTELMR
jgi:hypothetical protein